MVQFFDEVYMAAENDKKYSEENRSTFQKNEIDKSEKMGIIETFYQSLSQNKFKTRRKYNSKKQMTSTAIKKCFSRKF